jgi:hypothetical protein
MVAVTQVAQATPGRTYYDRKLAEGKSARAAGPIVPPRCVVVRLLRRRWIGSMVPGRGTGI